MTSASRARTRKAARWRAPAVSPHRWSCRPAAIGSRRRSAATMPGPCATSRWRPGGPSSSLDVPAARLTLKLDEDMGKGEPAWEVRDDAGRRLPQHGARAAAGAGAGPLQRAAPPSAIGRARGRRAAHRRSRVVKSVPSSRLMWQASVPTAPRTCPTTCAPCQDVADPAVHGTCETAQCTDDAASSRDVADRSAGRRDRRSAVLVLLALLARSGAAARTPRCARPGAGGARPRRRPVPAEPPPPRRVTLVALLTDDGQRIDQGVVWRVFEDAGAAGVKSSSCRRTARRARSCGCRPATMSSTPPSAGRI